MFKSETLHRIALPATVMAAIAIIVKFVTESDWLSQGSAISAMNIGSEAIVIIFYEFFALLTCYFLVCRRGKSDVHVWINYVIWILFMNIGVLQDTFHLI